MALAYIKGSEYETQDGVHWTEECRKKGVYDSSVKVSFIKKPIGHLFYFIGKTFGKIESMKVTYKK